MAVESMTTTLEFPPVGQKRTKLSVMAAECLTATLEVPLLGQKDVLEATIQWRLNDQAPYGQKPSFQTVDMLVSGITIAKDHFSQGSQSRLVQGSWMVNIAESKSSAFLSSVVAGLLKEGAVKAAIKLVLPAEDGYIVRSDFLEQRLYGCPNVKLVKGFVVPREHVSIPKIQATGMRSFSQIMASAAGGIVIDHKSTSSLEQLLKELEKELHSRYDLHWTSPDPIPEKTIVILGHCSFFMMERWIYGAKSLGVKIIMLGQNGSWLEEPQHAGLVEEFLAIDMNVDEDFPSRVLEALQLSGHKIDGIISATDIYFDAVAQVSLELDLHTSPIKSIRMDQDKYATRTRFGNEIPISMLVTSVEDLRGQIKTGPSQLTYPLIVKASNDWCSEGVFEVADEEDLFVAVEISSVYQPGVKIIVESYIDGPEVNAHFLLWNGEILFFEVGDDFPCSVDEAGSAQTASFQKSAIVYPSKLIETEKELLKVQIHKFLLDSGFRNGIHHVEARIQNSAMEYNVVDGVLDLRPKAALGSMNPEPEVLILEVNERCPGWMVIWATRYAYGIDYAALQMLAAINDGVRFRTLSQPFRNGAQASVESIFVPTECGGTIRGEIPICEELARRRLDLMKKKTKGVEIINFQTTQQPGNVVTDPSSGALSFVAAFNLATRANDRTEMLRMGQEITKTLRAEII